MYSFGASCLTLSKFVPNICKLLGDPNSQVRESAIETLVEVYRHVGEKVRIDLSKKGIPSSRYEILENIGSEFSVDIETRNRTMKGNGPP